jgi:hypothetical protein
MAHSPCLGGSARLSLPLAPGSFASDLPTLRLRFWPRKVKLRSPNSSEGIRADQREASDTGRPSRKRPCARWQHFPERQDVTNTGRSACHGCWKAGSGKGRCDSRVKGSGRLMFIRNVSRPRGSGAENAQAVPQGRYRALRHRRRMLGDTAGAAGWAFARAANRAERRTRGSGHLHVCDRRSATLHISTIARDEAGRATGLRGFTTTDDKESLLAGRFTNLLEGRIH